MSAFLRWLSAIGVVFALIMGGGWGCERPAQERSSALAAVEGSGEPASGGQERCVADVDCEGFYRCVNRSCIVPPAMTGEVSEETPRVVFTGPDGQERAQFYMELALTRREQQRGLMYRPHMRDDWGMIFVYDRDQPLSFWMKNTLIPLDMVFIDDGGEVVGVVERAEPKTLEPRTVSGLARYVFEINGGLAERYGIVAGDKMSLENVDERLKPRR